MKTEIFGGKIGFFGGEKKTWGLGGNLPVF
jgi:hypothetical protein